ncbi:MAG: DUF1624 domain-containing protein [Methanotrichaceae archaeon]|nr:DUF1624 domain-containing protein [Methanotrichaceae archaeon]
MDDNVTARFWEIDFLRGLAVFMMVSFHVIFDLDYFGIHSFNLDTGFWFYFSRLTASIFILLVGISLVLSYFKACKLGTDKGFVFKLLARGSKIFFLGLIITLITYLFIGNGFIVFGALHFIGISIIISYLFLRFYIFNLILGLVIVSIGLNMQEHAFDFPWLFWSGLSFNRFYTLDFFPLFPWFGVVLIGIFLGTYFYDSYERRFRVPELSGLLPIRSLQILGKNSLLIYLVHQPIIIAVIYPIGNWGNLC